MPRIVRGGARRLIPAGDSQPSRREVNDLPSRGAIPAGSPTQGAQFRRSEGAVCGASLAALTIWAIDAPHSRHSHTSISPWKARQIMRTRDMARSQTGQWAGSNACD